LEIRVTLLTLSLTVIWTWLRLTLFNNLLSLWLSLWLC